MSDYKKATRAKQIVRDQLQDLLNLTEEIKWKDEEIPEVFLDDLVKDLLETSKVMYAINGYQVWNYKS